MEHLTPEQNLVTFKLAQNYLNKGGTYRIALPDKNNPDPAYQSGTKPGGSDEGSHDHKLFFSLEDYKQLLKDTSFTLTPLEYYDNKGQFHFVDFDNSLGYISRSKKNNFHYPPIPNYSSLIFDLKIPV
jgi:predicted SAM-dependent methyltransferase